MKKYEHLKRAVIATLFLCIALPVFTFATGNDSYVTADDPLVSLSYITDVYTKEIESMVDEKLSAYTPGVSGGLTEEDVAALKEEIKEEIWQKIAEELITSVDFSSLLDSAVAEEVAKQLTGAGSSNKDFMRLQLAAGQKVIATGYCEIVLQSGSASVVGSSVYSSFTSEYLQSGGDVAKNHLLKIESIDGSGIICTWAASEILVRGSFDIVE